MTETIVGVVGAAFLVAFGIAYIVEMRRDSARRRRDEEEAIRRLREATITLPGGATMPLFAQSSPFLATPTPLESPRGEVERRGRASGEATYRGFRRGPPVDALEWGLDFEQRGHVDLGMGSEPTTDETPRRMSFVNVPAMPDDALAGGVPPVPPDPAPCVTYPDTTNMAPEPEPCRVVEIPTLEGTMTGQVGDWIITGVANETYPCKDEIFRATYEPVDDAAAPAAICRHCEAGGCAPAPPIVHRDVKPENAPAAEAKGEEMDEILKPLAEWPSLVESPERYDIVTRAIAAWTALRTRAREAEERAEKTTEHLLNSVAKAVRRGDELERERDEAREQLRAMTVERDNALRYLGQGEDTISRLDGLLAAATARAERAEGRYAASDTLLMERTDERNQAERRAAGILASLDTERAARVAAEAEVRHLKALNADYVKTHRIVTEGLNARLAAAEAEVAQLRAENEAGLDVAAEHRKRFRLRAAAAEAEVKRLTERLRLTWQDDPSLDATDGAHPAWWRGCDHGVRKAAESIERVFEEPLPLVGNVSDEVLGRVRQRVAALREEVRRLNDEIDKRAAEAVVTGKALDDERREHAATKKARESINSQWADGHRENAVLRERCRRLEEFGDFAVLHHPTLHAAWAAAKGDVA